MIDLDQMRADMAAGTPGPWEAEEKPGQLSEHDSKSSIGVWAQSLWDAAYEADPDDTDAADDAAWLCGIWGTIGDEDRANARRIARVPEMEAEILRLTAKVERLRAVLTAVSDETFYTVSGGVERTRSAKLARAALAEAAE